MARPQANIEYFHQVFDLNKQFGIPIECYHTETGPGVYEAALQYCEALEMADRAHLFKLMTKKIGLKRILIINLDGIIPCFMAKPYSNLPGCSGHIHLSLNSKDGKNLFHDNNSPDKTSKLLKSFAAGVLLGLPSIMALVAPNINRYHNINQLQALEHQFLGSSQYFGWI